MNTNYRKLPSQTNPLLLRQPQFDNQARGLLPCQSEQDVVKIEFVGEFLLAAGSNGDQASRSRRRRGSSKLEWLCMGTMPRRQAASNVNNNEKGRRGIWVT